MRMGGIGFKPDMTRTVHTLGYILRPKLNPDFPVPVPSDPHRAPRVELGVWPTQRGRK